MLAHRKSSTFTPYFPRFGNLLHGFLERLLNFVKVSFCLAFGMKQLNQNGPQSTCRKMSLQTFLDNLFSFMKVPTSHIEHNGFKLYFPFAFGFILGAQHNLYSSLVFTNHFEVFRVLEKSSWNLLWRYVKACSFKTKTCLVHLALVLHDSCCDHPNLPFDVVRAL